MANIFAGLDTPRWISPLDFAQANQGDKQAGVNFATALGQKRSEDFQINKMKLEQAMALQQQKVTQDVISPWLKEAGGATSYPDFLSKSQPFLPSIMSNPGAAKVFGETTKSFQQLDAAKNAATKAESQSIAGKFNAEMNNSFVKRLAALSDRTAAASIANMQPGKGIPSAQQMEALGLAEQSDLQAKQNRASEAELAATARGDVQTTEVNAKGDVVQKFAPPKASEIAAKQNLNATPQTKALPDGTTLAWMPGGKTLHVIQPSGKKTVLTPTQLQNLAKGMDDKDPRKTDINEFLANKAEEQIGKSPMALPKAQSDLKTGQKYNTARGVATWDGTQFVQ